MSAVVLSLDELGVSMPADPLRRDAAASRAAARFVGGLNRAEDRQWVAELFRADALGALGDLCEGVAGLADRVSAMLTVAAAAERDAFSVAGTVFSRRMLADAASRVRTMIVSGALGAAAELCGDLTVGFGAHTDADGRAALSRLAARCAPPAPMF